MRTDTVLCGIMWLKRWVAISTVLAFFLPAGASYGAASDVKNVKVLKGAEYSEPVPPVSIYVDLRDLPKPPQWKPGDPVKHVPRRHRFRPEKFPYRKPVPDPLLDKQLTSRTRIPQKAFTTPILNFEGQGFSGATPPDTVGDVGPSYYIQAINKQPGGTQYTVYSKADGSVVAGPFILSDLGGSGACASGYGDPIVLYDHLAGRWLLSEFPSGSQRYLCVYVSMTDDPVTGGWYNYQFSTPSFPDYPKYGLWTDGYYVTSNETGAPRYYVLERSKMLTGDSATSQRFDLPRLSGFSFQASTPCDVDGPAPPEGSPHYAMRHKDDESHEASPNGSEDYVEIFEFQVDWDTPGNSTVTGPIAIPVAEFDSNLNGLTAYEAIVQPGSLTKLDPLREVVMWRLQYRNFGTHEALIGCFVTDVDGTDHAGKRWFELRKTGSSWSLYQEGTYAPDVHSRWMGSISMDGSGNIALGYNISSASVYPGLRYTGRLASDPLGTMPQAETTVVSGTAASSNNRYGDYSSMNVDPVDDCTFWFTGEYNTGPNWSTRIAAFTFDACGCEKPSAPSNVMAVANGDNRIDISWTSVPGVTNYTVLRAIGACPQSSYSVIAAELETSPYIDTTVSGDVMYSYVVRSFNTEGGCESTNSACSDSVTTGPCTEPPVFSGIESVRNPAEDTCSLELLWSEAQPYCGSNVLYHIYRSTNAVFVPSAENRIAKCVTGTNYVDKLVKADSTYYYVVRCEDSVVGGDGPCVGGNSESNLVIVSGNPSMIFSDDMESGDDFWSTSALPSDSGTEPWKIVTTDSVSPTHSFFCLDVREVKDQVLQLAHPVELPQSAGMVLRFQNRMRSEPDVDGGVLEYSSDGGSSWFDILAGDGSGIPANPARFISGGYDATISSDTSPIDGRSAWSSTNSTFTLTQVDLSDMSGYQVMFRWRFACNNFFPPPTVTDAGWWVDDVGIGSVEDCLQGGYDSWRTNVVWTGTGDPDDDDNNDGVSNFEAYFYGVNPTGDLSEVELEKLPAIETEDGTNYVYSFGISTSSVNAASYHVEKSTNIVEGEWEVVLPTPPADESGNVELPLDLEEYPYLYMKLNITE